jgi:hypothetical protein
MTVELRSPCFSGGKLDRGTGSQEALELCLQVRLDSLEECGMGPTPGGLAPASG